MKKRKILLFLLALGMSCTLFAASCGTVVDGSSDSSSAVSESASEKDSSSPSSSGNASSETSDSSGSSSEQSSSESSDSSSDSSVDSSSEEKGMLDGYKIVNGGYREATKASVISSSANALAVKKEGEFVYGSLQATVKLSGARADNGIVFALTDGGANTYWENGVSYYFFFVSLSGTAYLGKVSNGWTVCGVKTLANYDPSGTYRLKVTRDDTTIYCYVDGELYLSYTDANPLWGKGYGMRAGASGVEFSDVLCESEEAYTPEAAAEYRAISGSLVRAAGDMAKTKEATLALHNTARLENGTFTISIMPSSSSDNGVIFGADDEADSYYRFYLSTSRYAVLSKVSGGTETMLQRGVLSAGYTPSGSHRLTVVREEGKISCYFDFTDAERICYASYTDAEPLTGARIGIKAGGAGTLYSAPEISAGTQTRNAETLLFGHSYMEMWTDYKTDFPEYSSIDNIGIGGSVASHWEDMIDQVTSYAPKLGIYMIGINDISGGVAAEKIADSAERMLTEVKRQLPDFKVVLVSVNHCPSRKAYTEQIARTNLLFRNLAASYDWIYYAETEYLFCSDKTDPTSSQKSYFTDDLHPTKAAYGMIAESIRSAAAGENQPEKDPTIDAEKLASARAAALRGLDAYSETALRAAEWKQARALYEDAKQKIEACGTLLQIENLDLSEELDALKKIKNNARYVTEHLLSASDRFSLSAEGWTKTESGGIRMSGFGYALDATAVYRDTEVTFRLDAPTGAVAVGGVFLRTSLSGNTGLNGYLINYVTDLNYLQVYYFQNCYNTNGSAITLQYIGGWVYPGSVTGTLFHAGISGSTLYLTTQEDYEKYGFSSAIIVDLTYNGTYEVYPSGFVGGITWTENVGFDLTLETVADEKVKSLASGWTQKDLTAALNAGASASFVPETPYTVNDDGSISMPADQWWLLDRPMNDAVLEFKVNKASESNIDLSGVLLRATQTENTGLDAYLVNIQTANNFVQVFRYSNWFASNHSAGTFVYLGGIVCSDLGKTAEGTTLRLSIEGGVLKIWWADEYAANPAGAGCLAVDLTAGGTLPLLESGSFGLSNNCAAPATLNIGYYAVPDAEASKEPSSGDSLPSAGETADVKRLRAE